MKIECCGLTATQTKQIRHMIYSGNHKAFGYVKTHTDQVVPALVRALVDKSEGKPE